MLLNRNTYLLIFTYVIFKPKTLSFKWNIVTLMNNTFGICVQLITFWCIYKSDRSTSNFSLSPLKIIKYLLVISLSDPDIGKLRMPSVRHLDICVRNYAFFFSEGYWPFRLIISGAHKVVRRRFLYDYTDLWY